ncbi:MAG: hypothetical protein HY795_17700 [Desulfovibrio sp.]|nr:hypothetical protein [Desulfovibrio sp.]MBI4960777.1 hypothetical protein [Desulfovibrio sp.]
MYRVICVFTFVFLVCVSVHAADTQNIEAILKGYKPLRMGIFLVTTDKGPFSIELNFEDGEDKFEAIMNGNKGKKVLLVYEKASVPKTLGHITEIHYPGTVFKSDALSRASIGK